MSPRPAPPPEQVQEVFDMHKDQEGIWAVVNCIGDYSHKPLKDTSQEEFRAMFELDVLTSFNILKVGGVWWGECGGGSVVGGGCVVGGVWLGWWGVGETLARRACVAGLPAWAVSL